MEAPGCPSTCDFFFFLWVVREGQGQGQGGGGGGRTQGGRARREEEMHSTALEWERVFRHLLCRGRGKKVGKAE